MQYFLYFFLFVVHAIIPTSGTYSQSRAVSTARNAGARLVVSQKYGVHALAVGSGRGTGRSTRASRRRHTRRLRTLLPLWRNRGSPSKDSPRKERTGSPLPPQQQVRTRRMAGSSSFSRPWAHRLQESWRLRGRLGEGGSCGKNTRPGWRGGGRRGQWGWWTGF